MESEILIRMTRWQSIGHVIVIFYSLVIFIKHFDPINIKRTSAPKITIFSRSSRPKLSTGSCGNFKSVATIPFQYLVMHFTFTLSVFYFRSRHKVLCQRPRKPCGTQVCYLQEPLTRCFLTLCISVTTRPISIKFTYFMPSIYTTLHTKLERNRPSGLRDMLFWKLPHFHLFLLLCTVLQK